LSRGEDPPSFTVFVDDVGTGGSTIEEAWGNTMKCLRRLSNAGFPISITKCKFLQLKLDYLGMVLADTHYGIGPKSLRNMLVGKLPTSIREVKGLLGRLNYASLFIPNYAKLV
jgi:hypothetical protein